LLLLLPSLTVAAAQPSMKNILERMRLAGGNVYEAHIASTSVPEPSGGIAEDDMQGTRFLTRRCISDLCEGSYFDGRRWYSVSLNATALPRMPESDPSERALRSDLSLDFLNRRFTAAGGRIRDGGASSFEGKPCRRIVVSQPSMVPTQLCVDTRSWLLTAIRDSDGNILALRDYRRVGRYRLPFEVYRNGALLRRYDSRTVVEAPLDSPQGLAGAFPTAIARASLDPHSATPIANCRIGDRDERCLIDSGNSGLAMSIELAEALGLQAVGAFRVSGLGTYATEVVRAGPLQMGTLQLPPANYVVLADIHRYGYDLVLGADLLAASKVTIDPFEHAITFAPSSPGDDADSVALAFENLVPVIGVTLDDIRARLAIDTGDQSNINLSWRFYADHPSLFRPQRTEPVAGVGGGSTQLIGRIESMRIGQYTALNQEIGTTQNLLGTGDGHLGAAFLSRFTIVLDYPQQRMRLLPAK